MEEEVRPARSSSSSSAPPLSPPPPPLIGPVPGKRIHRFDGSMLFNLVCLVSFKKKKK